MGIRKLIREFFGVSKEKPEDKYTVGVSLGPKYGDRVSQKLGRGSGIGVNFFEPYLTSPRSMTSKEVDRIKHAMKSFGVHLSFHDGTQAKICSADKRMREMVHDDMMDYIDKVSNVNGEWILFHSSEQVRPRYRQGSEMEMRRVDLVDEKGNKIKEEKLDPEKNPETRKWFEDEYGDRIISQSTLREARVEILDEGNYSKEEKRDILAGNGSEEAQKKIVGRALEKALESWNCQGPEMMAYEIMARWMYHNNDYLWQKICDGKHPDDVDEMKHDAAVSGKYLQGQIEDALDRAKEKDVKILIENGHGSPRIIHYMRLVRPENVYYVIKSINDPYVRMCVDFEHITIGWDPLDVLDNCPGDFGEYVESLHLSKPTPEHEHMPIERGNVFVYELLWKMKELGFREGTLIFEPGGQETGERIQDTVYSMREMVKYLSRDVSPDELPEEYFGLTDQEMVHERRIIETHTFDPLKGLLHSPELTDTFFGSEMARRGRRELEKWGKEEYR
ncbi:MAG: sugar phosphate isomerase/epimerase family protein [Candidatus Aenigmatarchaeota archaeon]